MVEAVLLPTDNFLRAKVEASIPTQTYVHLDVFIATVGSHCHLAFVSVTKRMASYLETEQMTEFNH